MGLLTEKVTKRIVILKPVNAIGRGKHNELVLSEPDVSKSHASLYWSKEKWYLKDHSTNGTLINGELVNKESRGVKKGDVIQFGKNHDTVFTIESDLSPCSYLHDVKNEQELILLDHTPYFPINAPRVSFFKMRNENWYLDDSNNEQLLTHNQEYSFCNKIWRFIENEPLEDTLIYKEQNECLMFNFVLSPDYEQVRLVLSNDETSCDLGQRVHNHLLLILAREKLGDLDSGQKPNLSGWISMDYLINRLRKELVQPNIDQYYINIMIHRIRKQFSIDLPFQTKVSDLIERNNGKLRFRYNNVKINQEEAA